MPKPDWRDPNMPVLVRMYNPSIGFFTQTMSPIARTYHALAAMHEINPPWAQEWRNDPTYHLRRKPNVPHKI